MPDETGTETTRSDAPSADESLFGDAADDGTAAVADEQDASKEAEQDPHGSDDAGDEAGAPEDVKVVIVHQGRQGHHRGAAALVGSAHRVLRLPGPVRVDAGGPGGGRKAKARWEDAPKHPAHERPAPPARRRGRRGQAAAQASNAEEGTAQQQPETLRLF